MEKYIYSKKGLLLIYFYKLISLLMIITIITANLYSQEEPKRAFMKFSYWKKNDGSKYLKASISYKEDGKFVLYQGGDIIFYQGEEEEKQLGEAKTNAKGEAELMLPEDMEADSSGIYYFSAKFKGNGVLKRASKSLSCRDAYLELSFNQKSKGRTVDITAYELVEEEKVEISDLGVTISVPTLFGDMVIGKGDLEEGTTQINFPENLPGDSLGNLEIIAKIVDSDEFGNVEKRESIPWGVLVIPTEVETSGSKGKLWTYNAPIWMVITLIILMTGVWSHFGYVIYKMYRINKEGKIEPES